MKIFTEAFDGGNGAVRQLTPPARLLCGVIVFTGCAVVPLNKWPGAAWLAALLLGWCACCGLPWRRLGAVLRFTLCVFLPLLLLAPIIRWTGGDLVSWRDALAPPLTLCARGVAGVVICAATLSTLTLPEFAHGMAALPLPRPVASVLVQLVHQTSLLADESRRMGDALRVRNVLVVGTGTRMRVLAALPASWLTRIFARAARVGDAMELRGFDGLPPNARRGRLTVGDMGAVALTLLVLGITLAMRWRGAA